MIHNSRSGLTLIEVIIYVGIFAIIGGLMTAILYNATRVEERETAGAEVTSQLNFVAQNIQRLIRESSYIEIEPGVATGTLKLRMADPNRDPTFIALSEGAIQVKEGSNATTTLTSDKVIVNSLGFKKFAQYPGHDTVAFDIAVTSVSQTPTGRVQRTIASAVLRASAATFDSDLVPGSAYTFNIGQSGAPWQNAYLSGVLNLGAAASDPSGQNGSLYYNTTQNVFRGYSNGSWTTLGGSGPWTVSGNNIYNSNSGNVGIGTTNPNALLNIYSNSASAGKTFFKVFDDNPNADTVALIQANSSVGSGTALLNVGVGGGSSYFYVRGDGNVGIGTTGPGYTLTVSGGAWVTSGAWSGSDARWKKDIAPLANVLNKVGQLQAVTFKWRQDEFPELKFPSGSQIGFVAQDVEPIFPELVTTDNNGYKGVSYERFVPVLAESIKELKAENDALKQIVCADHPQEKICE